MTVLPALYPNGDGSAVTMDPPVGAATYWDALDDDPHDGDATFVTPGLDSGGTLYLEFTDVPANLATLDTISVISTVRLNGTVDNDTTQMYVAIVAADETTMLASEVLVASQTASTAFTPITRALAIVGPRDKATWDGARLRYRWTFVKSKGSDGIALRITSAMLTGTYTASTTLRFSGDSGTGVDFAGLAAGHTRSDSGTATENQAVLQLTRKIGDDFSFSSDGQELTVRLLASDFGLGADAGVKAQFPDLQLEVWEAGVLRAVLDVVPLTGGDELIAVDWDASVLADRSGADVELRLVSSVAFDVNSVAWDASYLAGLEERRSDSDGVVAAETSHVLFAQAASPDSATGVDAHTLAVQRLESDSGLGLEGPPRLDRTALADDWALGLEYQSVRKPAKVMTVSRPRSLVGRGSFDLQ